MAEVELEEDVEFDVKACCSAVRADWAVDWLPDWSAVVRLFKACCVEFGFVWGG